MPSDPSLSSLAGMGVFRQSSLRALAPASLVVFAIIFLIVVIASLTGGDDSSSSNNDRVTITEPQPRSNAARNRARRARRNAQRGIYVVRAGDNLFTIANRTGIPIETLRQLNPTADPQGLVTGQHIRLRAPGETGTTGATGATGASGASGSN
jgi:LysM domain-containing protein